MGDPMFGTVDDILVGVADPASCDSGGKIFVFAGCTRDRRADLSVPRTLTASISATKTSQIRKN